MGWTYSYLQKWTQEKFLANQLMEHKPEKNMYGWET